MTTKSFPKGGREPWRNKERHYCAVCNSWMGSDRQSILLHEQGKKHQENVIKSLKQNQLDRKKEEQSKSYLQKTLAQITSSAVSSHCHDIAIYGDSALHAVAVQNQQSKDTVATTFEIKNDVAPPHTLSKREEKKAWISKKKKREEDKEIERDGGMVDIDERQTKRINSHRTPEEGNYTMGDNVYLEGATFINLLEPDMPIEIWIGNKAATSAEKRLPEYQHNWKPGIVVKIRDSLHDSETGKVLDISYLQKLSDTEETLEKSVLPNRLRIILGSDESIPDTLEEAQIAASGCEQQAHIVVENIRNQDIATNNTITNSKDTAELSSWTTVEIRTTTRRQELRAERERERQEQQDETNRLVQERRREQGRRMEEARIDNAEDSALGAFDVWNNGTEGYKGVNIHQTQKWTVAETTMENNIPTKGKVEFKKKNSFQTKKNKQNNRRITSSEDL
jgi:WW domain-binding protein 4